MAQHRFGFATLAGPPNVGKSTLLNRIIGQKISIVSRRPQTTRHRILGIKTLPEFQIAFVDTPGLHGELQKSQQKTRQKTQRKTQRKTLSKVINKTAISSMSDADVILFMIDYKGWSESRSAVFRHAKSKNTPIILLINKIDRLKDKSRLLPLIQESKNRHDFVEIVPISALKLEPINDFLKTVSRHLPAGPAGFPEDRIADRSERFLAAELVREQIFMTLGQELPYAIATAVDKFETNERGVLCIDIVIWVEKIGQKAIVIGKQGQQLKTIGMNARKQMERSFNKKVYLSLWVKVKQGWADKAALLHALGYTEN
ncbi:GTPase Era [Candidatus Spongiihabitans sp.]|uniref:GTPase Era n=1 Tax=Candidatus Spongiihabitans sp. TaxID=3101308 RepID=UPI003C7B3398